MPQPTPQRKPTVKKHLYLQKANDKLVCHCTCETAPITFPPQMDCPWCGCGWLFCCANCRKAFTFAVAVELNESWEETALRDLKNRGPEFEEPTEDDVAAWVEAMQVMCQDLVAGEEYVYLDGWFIPTNTEEIVIEGLHSYHEIDGVPQVMALQEGEILTELLGNQEYWDENQVEDEDEHEHGEYEEDEESDEDEDDDGDRR
jgi:hypothetical protein